ncbi:HTTM domain-containing protein [Natronolimnobius sp. AArcel1]|uniref:HTTM domain-containing protein n=1 Tax=Natronolimnobius sp. AArcel1 TaxID=1679093 RepID=UPI0013ED72B0|nr:HTTM domain-containing protein [Natronolimnobius sp. AArcel1]NGM68659.1 HTTM domain-containing protein [Natronolimnobius sp. AArcel1]
MSRELSQQARAIGERIQTNFRDCIRIDTRSLAVFRIFLGALVLADLVLRSRNFAFFYSGEGVVPHELAVDMTADNAFSIYYYASSPTQIAALMVIQALFALQLIVGYKTRVATIISFLFVISLDHHNPLVLSYADTLFRLLFFWAIFLPLGERWSVDAVHADRDPRGSFAGIMALFAMGQMVYMYFLNWYHKSQDSLWTTGEATPLIMGLDDMTFLLAEYVREFPTLLEYGGLLWYYMLMLSPFLIILIGRQRYPLILLFVGGHAMFAVTVRIGAFPYVAFAGLVLFIQPQLWRDGELVVKRLGIDAAVDTTYTEVRDTLERLAARVPRLRIDEPRVQAAKPHLYNVGVGVIIVSLIVFTLFTSLPAGNAVNEAVSPDEQIEDRATMVNIDQPEWSVFAPTPRTSDHYFVFAAETTDGEYVDVYNDDREVTRERPYDELQQQYSTYRERFYMNSVRRGGLHDRNDAPSHLAAYYCDTWEDDDGAELEQLTMHRIVEPITMDTIADPSERDSRSGNVYEYHCDGEEPETVDLPQE